MANTILVNVYQINQDPVFGGPVKRLIPSTGFTAVPLTNQVIGGVNIYSQIQMNKASGNEFEQLYYVVETVAQLQTLAG